MTDKEKKRPEDMTVEELFDLRDRTGKPYPKDTGDFPPDDVDTSPGSTYDRLKREHDPWFEKHDPRLKK